MVIAITVYLPERLCKEDNSPWLAASQLG